MRSSNIFAKGELAFGFCDRCDQRYPLQELEEQWVNRQPTGLRVCHTCMDIDHEQLRTDELPSGDAVALRNPRPDKNLSESRGLFGWNPVLGMEAAASLGNCSITT